MCLRPPAQLSQSRHFSMPLAFSLYMILQPLQEMFSAQRRLPLYCFPRTLNLSNKPLFHKTPIAQTPLFSRTIDFA
jgi:hypothetical protein